MRIIPNLKKHSINFPHQTDTDGIFVQTKTVKTVLRVGYAHSTLPAHAMRVAMSLHDGFGEITADRVTTNGKPLYKSPVDALELRSDVPVLPEDESDGGVARAACVAEATFEFEFNVTAAADIVSRHEGHPGPAALRRGGRTKPVRGDDALSAGRQERPRARIGADAYG